MILVILSALGAWLILGLIVALATRRLALYEWSHQLFIACDQLLNVLATPFHSGAWADETLSSRAYRAHDALKPWGRVLMPIIDIIFFWQHRHCEKAYIAERERLQAPPGSR
jgi:hypothetical protein